MRQTIDFWKQRQRIFYQTVGRILFGATLSPSVYKFPRFSKNKPGSQLGDQRSGSGPAFQLMTHYLFYFAFKSDLVPVNRNDSEPNIGTSK